MRIVLKVLNRGTGIAIRIVSSIGRIVSTLGIITNFKYTHILSNYDKITCMSYAMTA
jgi:hypothetical protein